MAVTWIALAVALIGSLTNWFTYPLSLETAIVASVLGVASIIVVPVLLFAGQQRSRSAFRVGSVLAVLGVGATGGAMREVLGLSWPSMRPHHVIQSPAGVVHLDSSMVTYYLELKNPFADGHEEFLTIIDERSTHRIRVPIFLAVPGGSITGGPLDEWAVLEPTLTRGHWILRTKETLRRAKFEIDVSRERAREVPDSTG